jgi:protein-L-isoaspartate(D-aspartate) O-methyltransferase
MMTTVEQQTAARARARFNMVEQQIRPWEVLDPKVLDLLHQVPREDCVPVQYRGLAYADLEIPLGHGQYMLSPKLEARMLQSLELKATDKVLEIGTGSGYMTALLAKLASHVYSVELVPELSAAAAHRLHQHGITNVTLDIGDAACGWERHAPYDVIVYTGSLPVLPDNVKAELAVGGRLFAVLGSAPVMSATLIQRRAEDVFHSDVLFETCIPEITHAPQAERFHF